MQFSNEQVELLKGLISNESSLQSETTGSSLTVQKDISLMALNTQTNNYTSWIVDLGASDHMTRNQSLFHKLWPCLELTP